MVAVFGGIMISLLVQESALAGELFGLGRATALRFRTLSLVQYCKCTRNTVFCQPV